VTVETRSVEGKKVQSVETPKAESSKVKAPSYSAADFVEFLGNVKVEFSKINWTSPEELKSYTKIVVAATFISGMALFLVDLGIQGVLGLLNAIIAFIA